MCPWKGWEQMRLSVPALLWTKPNHCPHNGINYLYVCSVKLLIQRLYSKDLQVSPPKYCVLLEPQYHFNSHILPIYFSQKRALWQKGPLWYSITIPESKWRIAPDFSTIHRSLPNISMSMWRFLVQFIVWIMMAKYLPLCATMES